jgi:hypothetical protein
LIHLNQEDEYARIEALGGKVIQRNWHWVLGVLAMSHSIGSHTCTPGMLTANCVHAMFSHDQLAMFLQFHQDHFVVDGESTL